MFFYNSLISKEHISTIMNTIIVRALAKINLAIDILGRREDGYHEVDMVTIPLKLHDSIEIAPIPDGQSNDTYLYCDDPTIICDESNLAYVALAKMKEKGMIVGNYQMMIHKRIPVEAGLGGGSADAACVIKCLDHYHKNKVDIEDECKIGLEIGSDVPFCVKNRPSRVRGRGEILEEIKVKKSYLVLIVKPNIGLSTKSVYEAYDYYDKENIKHPDIPALIKALELDDEKGIQENLINVLSYPAIAALPEIKTLLDKMTDLGLPMNGMSGTGSACFALSKDKKHLEHCMHILTNLGYACYFTEFAL